MKAYWNCEAEELKKNFQVSGRRTFTGTGGSESAGKKERMYYRKEKEKVWRRCLRSSFATCSL